MSKRERHHFEFRCGSSNLEDFDYDHRSWQNEGPTFSIEAATKWYAQLQQEHADSKKHQHQSQPPQDTRRAKKRRSTR